MASTPNSRTTKQTAATTSTPPEPSLYKDLILNVRHPIVLKHSPLLWPCLNPHEIPIERWAAYFDADTRYNNDADGIAFHIGAGVAGSQPQWEKDHRVKNMRMTDFLRDYADTTNRDEWASFSYRNLGDMPSECTRGIGLDRLGLERNATEDFTFWLGSRGAHTPCHYDTYGCNVVVQVYGSKLWLLLPPDAHLTPTRVPYEESSVYCTENFFSPDAAATAQFDKIEAETYCVVLHAGDVLIVPHKWWHYAENQTLSLSINSWIPLNADLDAQMDECIVRANVTEYTRYLSAPLQRALINPNELNNHMYDMPLPKQLQLLDYIAKHLRSAEERLTWPMSTYQHNYLSETHVRNLISNEFGSSPIVDDAKKLVRDVPKLMVVEYRKLMQRNAQRHRRQDIAANECSDVETGPVDASAEAIQRCARFINATCSLANVRQIKRSILTEGASNN